MFATRNNYAAILNAGFLNRFPYGFFTCPV